MMELNSHMEASEVPERKAMPDPPLRPINRALVPEGS
jgi:hypothetical protein